MNRSYLGMIGSGLCLILCSMFLFWHPYSSAAVSSGTSLILLSMLVLPALLGLWASLRANRTAMVIVLIWSLPYGLYLGVAAIPSIWNGFTAVLILYGLAARYMNKNQVHY